MGILLRGRTNIVFFRRRKAARKQFEDPVTQPVVAMAEPPISATKKAKTQPRKTIFQSKPAACGHECARLPHPPDQWWRASQRCTNPSGEKDMTFGTDPVQSKRVLDDPSISPLHARIKRTEDGSFIIYDHGSIAGTWVNFEPITREGRRLAHGDRIHFGQLVVSI